MLLADSQNVRRERLVGIDDAPPLEDAPEDLVEDADDGRPISTTNTNTANTTTQATQVKSEDMAED